MYHGGTNFGFLNGANTAFDDNGNVIYQPTVTSYDYDGIYSN
jgi:beta-galactosidase